MKYICTRYIDGNRGDLLSRYGILSDLQKLGLRDDITVMALLPEHTAGLDFPKLPYGKLYNTFFSPAGIRCALKADVVIWTGGLDLSDDSSILKLVYILFNFCFYRLLGLKIFVLNQGAGSIKTRTGMFLVKTILKCVKLFIARDAGSFSLLKRISPKTDLIQAYDGIFAGDFKVKKPDAKELDAFFQDVGERKVIGLNIRQWFHFSCSVLPNHLKRQPVEEELDSRMRRFLDCAIESVREIRAKYDAKVVLISAYEFHSSPTNDELPFLLKIKNAFLDDSDVIVTDFPLDLQEYLYLISRLDLMVGTRLHCTLAALRLNVPAINLNYTLKGRDIYRDLGLSEYILELSDYIDTPSLLMEKIDRIAADKKIRERIGASVAHAIDVNHSLYRTIFHAD